MQTKVEAVQFENMYLYMPVSVLSRMQSRGSRAQCNFAVCAADKHNNEIERQTMIMNPRRKSPGDLKQTSQADRWGSLVPRRDMRLC